jgi:hypothetical protein
MPKPIEWMPNPDQTPPVSPEEIQRRIEREKEQQNPPPRPVVEIDITPPPQPAEKPKSDGGQERGVWETDI